MRFSSVRGAASALKQASDLVDQVSSGQGAAGSDCSRASVGWWRGLSDLPPVMAVGVGVMSGRDGGEIGAEVDAATAR
ncbi:hypothetical protein GCM10009539_22580 [Cryptosporangium japonicum]|uniref:Uncharacterized protein n=1 Tax=Cryptosporangium japonicum TaxID=80872 RepID=A0ABP3DMP9_9ACTN